MSNKEETAMRFLIQQLKLHEKHSVSSQTGAYSHCIRLAESLLPTEKKQIDKSILIARIDENKSILKMAELHMDERSCMVLRQVIFSLEVQLDNL